MRVSPRPTVLFGRIAQDNHSEGAVKKMKDCRVRGVAALGLCRTPWPRTWRREL